MAGPAHDAGVLRLTETGRVALRTEASGSLKRDPREKKTKRAGTGPGQCSAGAACGLRNRRLALPGGPRRPPARRLPGTRRGQLCPGRPPDALPGEDGRLLAAAVFPPWAGSAGLIFTCRLLAPGAWPCFGPEMNRAVTRLLCGLRAGQSLRVMDRFLFGDFLLLVFHIECSR